MKLFNTLHKSVEEFVPREEGKIKMYTCGPTVYHFAHIGNLRTYISEDILEKGFRYLGYDVQRVMNITDVGHLVGDGDTGEDKMLVAAKREHKSSRDIAKYYTECFFDDCRKLNIKKPDVVSNATDNIAEYINVSFENIQVMIFKNYDEILKTTFGDYMQLPPEDKRKSHGLEAYWRNDNEEKEC